MICPYNQTSHIMVNSYEHDEDTGELKTQIIKEFWGQCPCLKEECGAWKDGRCKYNEL